MSLKMIILDKTGEPIGEIAYRKAIKNFLPYRDYICFYSSGGVDTTIEIFDRNVGEVVFSAGKTPTQEHIMLSRNESAGGMARLGNNLFFAYADRPTVEIIDLEKLVNGGVYDSVKDAAFTVNEIHGDAHDIFNGSRNVALSYLSENSFVNGIFVTNDKIFVKATTGSYKINRDFSIEHDNRANKLYVIDHEFNHQSTFVKNYDYGTKDKWYSSDNNGLYYIEFVDGASDSLNYALMRVGSYEL
jgi:hypothetical protein